MDMFSRLLELSGTRHTMTGIGKSLQPGSRNRGGTLFTSAKRALVDPFQRLGDLFERLFLVLEQAEGEFVIVVVRILIRGVTRHSHTAPLSLSSPVQGF